MHSNNEKVVSKLGLLVDLNKDQPFKAKAFAKALQAIRKLGDIDIATKLTTKIPDVGPSSLQEIKEILETGTSSRIENLLKDQKVDPKLFQEIIKIPGVGPARAKDYIQRYKLKNFDDIKLGIAYNEIKDEVLIEGMKRWHQSNSRVRRSVMMKEILPFLSSIKEIAINEKALLAGSIRRKLPTNKDIDIVIASKDPEEIKEIARWHGLNLINSGTTKIRAEISVEGKMRGCDIVIVPEKEFACALMYLTGSKDFNISFRSSLQKMGYSLNEHCITNTETGEKIYPESEEDIFKFAGMEYVKPENR